MLVSLEALAESFASPVYEVSFQCFVVFGVAGVVPSVMKTANASGAEEISGLAATAPATSPATAAGNARPPRRARR